MKKLLIIQLDDAYFLVETLQVLEKDHHAIKGYDLTVLVKEAAYQITYTGHNPLIKGITINKEEVIQQQFDVSVNLSLSEESWDFHGKVKSDRKIGAKRCEGVFSVEDLWSTFLLTLKNKSPFLTFHLQQIYRNILGIRSSSIQHIKAQQSVTKIVYGASNTGHFSATEQENFINGLTELFKGSRLYDISEIDLVEDVSQVLYLGPASIDSLRLCESGATGIFLSSGFQGFNLLPSNSNTIVISSRGSCFTAKDLLELIQGLRTGTKTPETSYSLYRIENDVFNGPYLSCDGKSDLNYPFYQAHVVLWNFLLNLTDIHLIISKCNRDQFKLLDSYLQTVSKFIKLHEFALKSIDNIYYMGKQGTLSADELQNKLKIVEEVDIISKNLAASHPLLRQFFDFYQLRKSQGLVTNFMDEAQTSYLIYNEEHQAFRALEELFSVTLRKNEVSI